MKQTTVKTVLSGMILILALGVPFWVQADDKDETNLESVRKDIDKDTAAAKAQARTQELAAQFKVDPSVVQDLRANKQGWGETTIELSMAQHLTQSNPKDYPTMTDALNKISAMRADKMGWGKIANDLGFKLGPVVSEAMHVRNEMHKESRMERSEKNEKHDRAEMGGERPDHGGRPDRPNRPEHPERSR
jgi:hypothetical protein